MEDTNSIAQTQLYAEDINSNPKTCSSDSPQQLESEEYSESYTTPPHSIPRTSDDQSQTNASENNDHIFEFGPYVPIIRRGDDIFIEPRGVVSTYFDNESNSNKKRLLSEVLPDDAILETPSLVTPILLKKKTKWPERPSQAERIVDNATNDDDIEVIKMIGKVNDSSRKNTKDVDHYVRLAAVAGLTNIRSGDENSILTIENYYDTDVGNMLLSLGLSRVFEYNLESKVRRVSRKLRKTSEDYSELAHELETLKNDLIEVQKSNKPYKSDPIYRCTNCSFKTEFRVVLEGHLEVPHQNNRKEYLCNFCSYKIKDAQQMVSHHILKHKRSCLIEKNPPVHNCRYCTFETSSKRKMVTHTSTCERIFPIDKFLGPDDYGASDFPAITPKPISQEDVRCYEQTLKSLRLSAYNPHQLKVSGSSNNRVSMPVLLIPRRNQLNVTHHGQSDNITTAVPIACNPLLQHFAKNPQGIRCGQLITNNGVRNQSKLLQLLASQNQHCDSRVAILQHPRNQSTFINGKSVMNTAPDIIMGPTQQVSSNSDLNHEMSGNRILPSGVSESSKSNPVQVSKGSTFVICEICDGYIKDLTQLRSHMQYNHKVKIHQKTLVSRPPLSCQRCHWRFFTDQGLERHLLGAHGLVTSNMQEQVEQGTDSGRCTICGRAFNDKLVAHMKDVHKSTLKPAHLSYKCTVCSATFNLYRLFENHVFSVHTESIKRQPSGN